MSNKNHHWKPTTSVVGGCHDISLPIYEGMTVYPNNPKPVIKRYSSIPNKKTNESLIRIGSHTGTHFDSALHVYAKGWSTSKPSLSSFFGDAIVADVGKCGKSITESHLSRIKINAGDIVLLKTENSNAGYRRFYKDYAYLDISGARYLAGLRVKAVGIDYLGIEKFGGDMSVHKALLRNNILIFEGLYLKGIRPGRYKFYGFPIKIDADAAPVRAVLMK